MHICPVLSPKCIRSHLATGKTKTFCISNTQETCREEHIPHAQHQLQQLQHNAGVKLELIPLQQFQYDGRYMHDKQEITRMLNSEEPNKYE